MHTLKSIKHGTGQVAMDGHTLPEDSEDSVDSGRQKMPEAKAH